MSDEAPTLDMRTGITNPCDGSDCPNYARYIVMWPGDAMRSPLELCESCTRETERTAERNGVRLRLVDV